MELYYPDSNEERRLSEKADRERIPIGGVIELLPLCNMDCKMCYVRMSKAEMDRQGKMLSCSEWLQIADNAAKAGTLFLTLTGGEPLLYPEFKTLYAELIQRGFILRVNTNGTLIDEEWADFFAKHGCRELSITLYGADDATYEKLCGNPEGFSQVLHAANLLKSRGVAFRFTCSLTPYNEHQLELLHDIAKRVGVPLSVATYMFPAIRREISAEKQMRFTPEQAAAATLKNYCLKYPNDSMEMAVKSTAQLLRQPPRLRLAGKGFRCHAGHSGYWMNWKGEMTPCGMFAEPRISLKTYGFEECWAFISDKTMSMPKCKKCLDCPLQNLCNPCPANNYTETGSTGECPEYLCEKTKALMRLCMEYMKTDTKK
ncbi:MAG: radical SAM protein [Clostridia bacterium]|nr:radical SAM protein [Clostridia bacterium]